MKAWIYFLRSGTGGPIKIGRASNPVSRAQELNIGSPTVLILLGAMQSDLPKVEERAIHRRLASQRIKGEWFEAEGAMTEIRANQLRFLKLEDLRAMIALSNDDQTKTASIHMRCFPEEVENWRLTARARKMTCSAFVRQLCNEAAALSEREEAAGTLPRLRPRGSGRPPEMIKLLRALAKI